MLPFASLAASEFDLRAVLEEAGLRLRRVAERRGLGVRWELDEGAGGVFGGDGRRIRELATALGQSALEFATAGDVVIAARMMERGPDRARVRVEVRTQEPALELGPAISPQLADLAGGEIGFASEGSEGAVFWFEMELKRADDDARLPREFRVLIVDGAASQRESLLAQVRRLGVETEAVGDAAAALALLRTGAVTGAPWSVVLTDWTQSPQAALELAIEVRADELLAQTALVMVSPANANDAALGTAAGVEAILRSPVNEVQLRRCLSRLGERAGGTETRVGMDRRIQAVDPQRGLRLLLAEDNPASQTVATLLLAKMGHAVDVASNGREALDRLASGRYDAVLMDCQMPVLDGYETTRRIRGGVEPGVNPRLPVIALTTHVRREERRKWMEAGMNASVTKPMRVQEVREALGCVTEARGNAAAAGLT